MLARGVVLTYETIRSWCAKFGPDYAAQLRRRRPRPGDNWHFDEVFVKINGTTHYLWRAVDQHGNVLNILVQSRRNAVAAKRFFRKLLKGLRYVPRVIVTDKLASYQLAHRELLQSVTHRRSTRASRPLPRPCTTPRSSRNLLGLNRSAHHLRDVVGAADSRRLSKAGLGIAATPVGDPRWLDPEIREGLGRGAVGLASQAAQNVLGVDEVMAAQLRLMPALLDRVFDLRAKRQMSGGRSLGRRRDRLLHLPANRLGAQA